MKPKPTTKKVRGAPLHLVVYDIEIERPSTEPKLADAKRGDCGISIVCVWDNLTGRPHLYDKHNIEDCIAHLNAADLNIGWNSLEFDKPALEGYTKLVIEATQLDIRPHIMRAVGDKYAKGYKLGDVCERTMGISKSGEGMAATSLFAQGRFAELFDYNINDVWLTRALHNFIVEQGFIMAADNKPLRVRGYPTKEYA